MSNSMLMKGNSVAFCFCLAFLFLTINLAFAACDPATYAQEITLQGVGTAYVGNLRFDPVKDEAELSDGVCFVSEGTPQLTLSAPTMRVEKVQTKPEFVAQGATLTLATYTVFAEELSGNAAGLGLRNLSIMSPQFSGTAVRARYTLETAQTIFSGVNLKLGNFRVEGAAAGLTENTLVLRSARATTCACKNGGLYALTAPEVVIDLGSGLVRVEQGTLETLGLRFGLTPNLRLLLGGEPRPGSRVRVGGAALLPAAPSPEPVGTVVDEGTRVALPLQLAPWGKLELGAAGLDAEHPLGLVSLLRLGVALGQSNLQAVLGRTGPGLRADALLRTPLTPDIGVDLSTTNRLWADADFVREGTLGMYGGRRLRGVVSAADTLVLGGQLFAALSQQTLAGAVVRSPRLGVRGSLNYVAPTAAGVFGLRTETALTFYPRGGADDTQLGVRLQPSWRQDFGNENFGNVRVALGFDQQTVYGTSPFSVKLDRLEPRSVLDAALIWGGGARSLRIGGVYALTLSGAENPFRRLRLDATMTLPVFGVVTRNTFSAEVAGLLGPPDPDVNAFVIAETGLELPASPLELGVRLRYELLPRDFGLKLLEVYASYPLTLENLTLRPFLGLNAAPLLVGDTVPIVSGYGLEVAYRSCCGTLRASYRFHDQSVKTSFDVRLADVTP